MRLISLHDGKLRTIDSDPDGQFAGQNAFSSGIAELDALAPGGAFARGAVHEFLTEPGDEGACYPAIWLARAASINSPARSLEGISLSRYAGRGEGEGLQGPDTGWRSMKSASDPHPNPLPAYRERGKELAPPSGFTVFCDPHHTLYPPALAAMGFALDRLYLLHPSADDPRAKDLIWAVAECLRCRGVSAAISALPRLSRIEARRLQLAAEQGGGVGILLRRIGRDSAHHAAATRWFVQPAPGEKNAQRWTIQLIHGHGGRVGTRLCLEISRETHHLRAFDPMADRSIAQKPLVRAS